MDPAISQRDWKDLAMCASALEEGVKVLGRVPVDQIDPGACLAGLKAIQSIIKRVRGRSDRVKAYMDHDCMGEMHTVALLLSKLGESVDLVRSATQNTANAINSLRYWVEGEELEAQPVSINAVVELVMLRIKDKWKTANFVVNLEEGLTAETDRATLGNLLINMASNAFGTGSNWVFCIEGRREGDKVIIEIQDDGTGIDKDVEQKLFEEGYSGNSYGNGLGLGAIQERLKSIGGDISCEGHGGIHGRKPNGGAKFIITLPVAG